MMQRQGRPVRSIVVNCSEVGHGLRIVLPNATIPATKAPIQRSNAGIMADAAEPYEETNCRLTICRLDVGTRSTRFASNEIC
jgi:hypothetical protein